MLNMELVDRFREDLENTGIIVLEVHSGYASALMEDLEELGFSPTLFVYGEYNSTCVLISKEPIIEVNAELSNRITGLLKAYSYECDTFEDFCLEGSDIWVKGIGDMKVYDIYFLYVVE